MDRSDSPNIEFDELRKVLFNEISEEQNRALRIREIRLKVKKTLEAGNPVTITPEMEELGIAKEILAQCYKTDYALRMQKLHEDED